MHRAKACIYLVFTLYLTVSLRKINQWVQLFNPLYTEADGQQFPRKILVFQNKCIIYLHYYRSLSAVVSEHLIVFNVFIFATPLHRKLLFSTFYKQRMQALDNQIHKSQRCCLTFRQFGPDMQKNILILSGRQAEFRT